MYIIQVISIQKKTTWIIYFIYFESFTKCTVRLTKYIKFYLFFFFFTQIDTVQYSLMKLTQQQHIHRVTCIHLKTSLTFKFQSFTD